MNWTPTTAAFSARDGERSPASTTLAAVECTTGLRSSVAFGVVLWGQVFTFDDQRRALSANVQSTTCCGLAVIFSFALNVPTEIHSSTTASGTVRSQEE